MKYKISILLFVFLLIKGAYAKQGKISNGLEIKVGTLENGLRYYLRSNPAIKGKANFYLVQKAGAILEDDSQNGLAHFLEHMCFKGTKNFPGNSIFETFEKHGLKNKINAYTGVEETVYHMNDIPVKDGMFLDQCLVILYDWCNSLNLEQDAIDTERPVIVEEIRMRSNLQFRIKEKISPFTYNNSKFSKRFIAGTADIIKNFKREELEKFYHDWYRTDLQAIVIVGDISLFEVEEKIKKLFGKIPKVENPKPFPVIEIAENSKTYYTRVNDPEIKDGSISICFRHKTDKNIKARNLDNIINSLYRRRLSKLMKEDSLYLKSASINYYPVCNDYSEYRINVTHKKDMAKEALKKVTGVHNDILKNGFTKEEYDFITDKMLEQSNYYKKSSYGLPNEYYFEQIKYHFIHNEDIYDVAEQYKVLKKQVENTTLEDIKNRINNLYNSKNKTIVIYYNGEDKRYLTQNEVEEIEKNTEALCLLPDETDDEDGENMRRIHLVNKELTGSKAIKSETIKPFSSVKWTLKNGATIIYKQNRDAGDIINIYADSWGGNSVLEGEEYINSLIFNNCKECFGVEGMSKERMDKWLKDNDIEHKLLLDKDKEEIIIATRMKGLEKSFELLYSIFEQSAFYKDKYDEYYKKLKNRIEGTPENFKTNLRDTIAKIQKGVERHVSMNKDFLNKLSFDKLQQVYKNRYQDASNFTFYIVGPMGKSLIKKLSEKYIGAISSTNSNEKYRTIENPFPKNYNQVKLKYKMVEPKAGNVYLMNADTTYSFKEKLCFDMMNGYLQTILQRALRQGLNATYSVRVEHYIEETCTKNCGFKISYECDPEKIDTVSMYTNGIIDFIAKNGINQRDFLATKKKMKKALNIKDSDENVKYLKSNQYYLQHIISVYEEGEDTSKSDFIENTFKEIDFKYMNRFIINFFKKANIVDFIYLPKEKVE